MNSGVCQCSLTKIGRIQFIRSIGSRLPENSIVSVKIVVCSEFNDPLDNAYLADSVFIIRLLSLLSIENKCAVASESMVASAIEIQSLNSAAGIHSISFQLPSDTVGVYSVAIAIRSTLVCCSSCSCPLVENLVNGAYVMPLISEPFEILASSSAVKLGSTLLGCYRIVPSHSMLFNTSMADLNEGKLPYFLINEQYGATLGSHLYDSSLILLRYFDRNPDVFQSMKGRGVVVELGAGCGLIGMYCAAARSGTLVYLTDMLCQKRIISHNLMLNKLGEQCKFVELDWSCAKHVQRLQQLIVSDCLHESTVDILIATDVLYDREAAILLFNTIRRLASPGVTVVFVAQKLRENRNSDSLHVDIRLEKDIVDVVNVYEEADVIVWKCKVSL